MGRMIWMLTVLAVVLMIPPAAAGCTASPPVSPVTAPAPPEGIEIGNLAADFRLQDLNGQEVLLSSLRGRPVLLNFWASWCGPCREEMPFIQQVFEDKKWTDRGLMILAVNIGENPATVAKFMKDFDLTFTALTDTTQSVAKMYNIRSIPTTILIGKDGVIQDKIMGAFPGKAAIEKRLEKIVQ